MQRFCGSITAFVDVFEVFSAVVEVAVAEIGMSSAKISVNVALLL